MRYSKTIFIIICLTALSLNSATGQSQVEAYKKLSKQPGNPQHQAKFDSIFSISQASGDFLTQVELLHLHAIYFIRNPWLGAEKSLEYGEMEVDLLESGKISNSSFKNVVKPEVYEAGYTLDSLKTRALSNLSRFYKRLGYYNKAIEGFETIIEINITPLRVAQAYAEIGFCRNKMGDFFNAISFYKKGLNLLEELGKTKILANQTVNLAIVYRNIGTLESFEEGQKALERAYSLRNVAEMDSSNIAGLLTDLGTQYISQDRYNFQKAHDYYQAGLQFALEVGDSSKTSLLFNNLAHLYNLKKSDSALYYHDRALPFVVTNETKARLFDTRSDYYLYQGNLKQALNDIQSALEINLNKSLDLDQAPDILDLSKSALKDYTIYCLRKKTEILVSLFEQTNENKFLTQAIALVRSADELIDLIQSGSYESETKLLWRRAASEIYIKGVYAAHLLQQPGLMFYFIEKNRALLLSEEIATNTAFTSLPGDITDQSQTLKKNVLRLENQYAQHESKLIGDSLFIAKKQFEYFTDSIKSAYPDYFERKVDINTISLSAWQQQLKPDTTFISYAWNQLNEDTEILMGLAVDHEKTESFAITATDSLKSIIAEYQQLISHPFRTAKDQGRSAFLSNALYHILLPTSSIREMAQNKKLLIVPDGSLQYIPFEALVTHLEDNTFLISETDVSYLYSVSFLKYNDQLKRTAPNRFTGYAPVKFKKKTGLLPLQQTRTELNAIENEIGGKIIFDRKASKSYFLNHSDDYRMIHLATHADASGTPWIAFSDEKLELHELYTYKNNAELVTLSACNTLQGEMASGEGVLSLSRGFFYSGAKSVMASLWNVDDKATSSIMADFYANLDAGQGKSEALANAKRDYLKTHSLSEQSPYYWSSIILMGDSGIVDMSVSYSHLYLIASLVLALVILAIFRKKLGTSGNI